MSLDLLITAIEATDLSRKQKGIYLGMAARAALNGSVVLSFEEAQRLCECTSDGHVRRLLIAGKQAGLIHYSTNAQIYVHFLAWPTDDANDPSPRAGARGPRAGARGPRADDQNGGIIGGIGLDGSTTPSHSGDHDPSNPIQKADQQKTVALLTDPDIALARAVAVEIAQRIAPLDVFRQCIRYLLDRADGSVTSSGALIHRLANPDKFPPQPVDARDRKLAYYQRHAHTVGEDAANTKNYVPDEFSRIINC